MTAYPSLLARKTCLQCASGCVEVVWIHDRMRQESRSRNVTNEVHVRSPNAPGMGPPNFTLRGADQLYAPPARPIDGFAKFRERDPRQRSAQDPRAGPGRITIPVASPYGFDGTGVGLGRAEWSDRGEERGVGAGGENARWVQVDGMRMFAPKVVDDGPHGDEDDSSSKF